MYIFPTEAIIFFSGQVYKYRKAGQVIKTFSGQGISYDFAGQVINYSFALNSHEYCKHFLELLSAQV